MSCPYKMSGNPNMCVVCLGNVNLSQLGSYVYMGSTTTTTTTTTTTRARTTTQSRTTLGHIVCKFCYETMDRMEDYPQLCSLCHVGSTAVCFVWSAEQHGNCFQCFECLIKSVQNDKKLVGKLDQVFGRNQSQ
jgi:hypothetical protein